MAIYDNGGFVPTDYAGFHPGQAIAYVDTVDGKKYQERHI